MVLEINETVIVIGPCSHRVDPDVKEAGGRVRSQLTVGQFKLPGLDGKARVCKTLRIRFDSGR